jgi:hypothetical protein
MKQTAALLIVLLVAGSTGCSARVGTTPSVQEVAQRSSESLSLKISLAAGRPTRPGVTTVMIAVDDASGRPVARAHVVVTQTSDGGSIGSRASTRGTWTAREVGNGVYEADVPLAAGSGWALDVAASSPTGRRGTARIIEDLD